MRSEVRRRGGGGGESCSCNQSTILQTEGKRQREPTADGAVEMTEAK